MYDFRRQNYGANKPERCLKATKLAFIQDLIFAVSLTLILLTGKYLLLIFNDDSIVISMGMVRLRYILLAEGINVIIEITSGCMSGYGYSFVPALISIVGICGMRIGWCYTAFVEAFLYRKGCQLICLEQFELDCSISLHKQIKALTII